MAAKTEENVEWLSQAAFDKLNAELEQRSTTLREEITKAIASARAEGDLKENSGYHAARDEQGKNEARIKELEFRLSRAKVGSSEDSENSDEVVPGRLITADLNNSGKPFKFVLGSRDNADEEKGIDAYSPSSPLGQAIIGKSAGETTSYLAPNGKEISVKIVSVSDFN